MFGYPCAFLGGHMFSGLFQDHFILRLPDVERAKFLKEKGTAIFEPMPGRPMKEYVLVPPQVLDSDSALQPWLRLSRDYVSGLPPKANKPKKAGKTAKAPPRAAASKPAKRGRLRRTARRRREQHAQDLHNHHRRSCTPRAGAGWPR
jgi:hypothetical protein